MIKDNGRDDNFVWSSQANCIFFGSYNNSGVIGDLQIPAL
jgi:hypothetical protein